MALMKLVYRDQIFPREPYWRTFERLVEALPERTACRQMVEAELADLLAEDAVAGRLPDMVALRQRSRPIWRRCPRWWSSLAP